MHTSRVAGQAETAGGAHFCAARSASNGVFDSRGARILVLAFLAAILIAVARGQSSLGQESPPDAVLVHGNVVVNGGGPLPPFAVSFTRFTGGARAVTAAIKDATGSFTAELPEGDYNLTWNALPAGYSLQSIRHGANDALTHPLKIAKGATAALSVVLGVSSPPPWGPLRGRVVGTNLGEWKVPRKLSLRREPFGRYFSQNGWAVPSEIPNHIPIPDTVIEKDGSFEFPMVLPGPYRVTVADIPFLEPQPIVVDRKSSAAAEIAFPPIRTLAGRIRTDDGVPPEGTEFAMYAPSGNHSTKPELGPDGAFELTLPDGEFNLVVPDRNLPFKYFVKEFSAGSTDLRKDHIRVSRTTGEIRLLLGLVPRFKVSGFVEGWAKVAAFLPVVRLGDFETRGTPWGIVPEPEQPRVDIEFGYLDKGRGATTLSAPVGPDGAFEFPAVPPGNHTLKFEPHGRTTPPTATFKVGNADVAGVRIPAPAIKTVRGRVRIGSGRPVPIFHLRVAEGAKGVIKITPAADGWFSFQLPQFPPARMIGIATGTLPPGYRLSSMSPELTMHQFSDWWGDPIVAFELSLDRDALHRIAGTVAGPTGSTQGLMAELKAEADPRYATRAATQSAAVGADGSFEFTSTFPGKYTVRIVSRSGSAAAVSVPVRVTVADKDVTGLLLAIPRAK